VRYVNQLTISGSTLGTDENGDVIYEKASTSDGDGWRVFDETKHYLWPVPETELIKNS
jgi:hypothetical protein